MPSILFLCTGNYYRSRFAEHLFNHRAPALCPGWTATSRGLALERGAGNVGPISQLAANALSRLGVALPENQRMPQTLAAPDLEAAERVVAVKAAEHRPLLLERFPDWSGEHLDEVEFWDVDDIEVLAPDLALARLETQVDALARNLPRVATKSA